jgi:hypothetical protein
VSDELKSIYEAQHPTDWAGRFFDSATPCDLFRRGDKKSTANNVMEPTLVGWMANKGTRLRAPDVLVQDNAGASPQYQDGKMQGLKLNVKGENMTGSQRKTAAASMVVDGANLIVKGCRNSRGDHRGLSLNNKVDLEQKHYVWFEIIKNTNIPAGLAVIRDAAPGGDGYAHYTVAPKDDMPLSLFLANLGSLLPAGAKIHKPGAK